MRTNLDAVSSITNEECFASEASPIQDNASGTATTTETITSAVETLENSADAAVAEINSMADKLTPESILTSNPANAVSAWIKEVREIKRIIRERSHVAYSERSREELIEVVTGVIEHRAVGSAVCLAATMFDSDLDGSPISLFLPENSTIEDMKGHLKKGVAAIQAGVYLMRAFLLASEVHDIDILETGTTLADLTQMQFSSALPHAESQIIDSQISYPFWTAAMEEIIWNANKYGANKIHLWKEENGYYCFGNNGFELTKEQANAISGGRIRLYKDIEGTGQGISLMRAMGFDFVIRPATPEERENYGVNTVAQLKPNAILVQSP